MANASPQSPVPGSLGREQSKHLLANIELGWAPPGVVIYIITRADSFIGASVYPAQVTTPIVLTPPRSHTVETEEIIISLHYPHNLYKEYVVEVH